MRMEEGVARRVGEGLVTLPHTAPKTPLVLAYYPSAATLELRSEGITTVSTPLWATVMLK